VTLLELVAAGESKPVNQLNVIISGDETLKQLNSDYGGFAEATDVLSFDLSDESVSIEGDIYISMDRAVAQAAPRGEHPSVEVCRLAVHGLLHLCGWDHEDDVSLASMMDRGEKYLLEVGQEP
jgi:probable rRNA maturation factor